VSVPFFFFPQIKILENDAMPAPRKPTTLLQLVGAFDKNPQRARVDPVSAPLKLAPPRPKPITFAQAWNLIAKSCPEGVLAERDRVWLELVAALFVEYRNHGIAEMHPAKHRVCQLRSRPCATTSIEVYTYSAPLLLPTPPHPQNGATATAPRVWPDPAGVRR
jgi:hypothetical protein